MRATFASATAFCAVLAAFVSAAYAQICNAHYPIRATGAACSGSNATAHITRPHDGVVTCCIATERVIAPRGSTYYGPNQYQRVQAGLAMAGSALGILGEFAKVIESWTTPTPDERWQGQVRAERADAAKRAAQWHQSSLISLRAGDDRSAIIHMEQAVRAAEELDDANAVAQYEQALRIIRAQAELKEALALRAERRYNEAFSAFGRAKIYARNAERADLAARIEQYRQEVQAEVRRLPPQQRRTIKQTKDCSFVNGQYLCD